MSKPFSDFTGVFFWDFKRMDNVNYNFKILELLYKTKKRDSSRLFNKPILVTLVSIIECALYDFVKRVDQHRGEVVPNLDKIAVIDSRRKTYTDQLETIIAYIKKHDLLRASEDENPDIYDILDFLRKIRNRLHIQNSQNFLDENEYKIWTEKNLHLGEKALERVCEVLCHVYPRPGSNFYSMSDFPRVWE